jgi:hypothetical protein
MTASSHLLSKSLFFIIQTIDTTEPELLIASLSKVLMNKTTNFMFIMLHSLEIHTKLRKTDLFAASGRAEFKGWATGKFSPRPRGNRNRIKRFY